MLRFRLIALCVSAVICGIITWAAATHRITGIEDLFDSDRVVNVFVEKKPPPPPPPPPPDRPPPPPPPIVMRQTEVVSTAPPVITDIPVAPKPEPAPPAPPPAPPAPPAPPQITAADFIKRPDGAAYARFYPSRAMEREKTGSVQLRCQVLASGRLTNCAILDEEPSGWGFGEASVRIAREFQVRPQTEDGRATDGGSITFRIRWNLG
jgi:protein TonB